MKNILLIISLIAILTGCEKDTYASDYSNLMTIRTENDFANADNYDKIKVIAEFPEDFNTEEDNKIDFLITKNNIDILEKTDLVLTNQNGILKKTAELFISNIEDEQIEVKAIFKANNISTSKKASVTFKKAFLDDLTISTSSYEINPNSFSTITLTTKLIRNFGIVTLKTPVITKAFDNNNNEIGFFVEAQNQTDNKGEVINKFTLGNNSYIGPIKIVSTALNADNTPKSFEITIYSNN